jgi:peptide-methionine (S)-S-oxide reductase
MGILRAQSTVLVPRRLDMCRPESGFRSVASQKGQVKTHGTFCSGLWDGDGTGGGILDRMMAKPIVAILLGVLTLPALGCGDRVGSETTPEESKAKERGTMDTNKTNLKKAIFAAGCFWGVEASFRKIDGVVETQVGYTGGKTENPTYREVCTDRTGHAEAVEITYDPDKVSYRQLLDVFWSIHDPTQINRQGPDVGSQYRSAIFYLSDEQARAARQSKERLEKSARVGRPIATEIVPATEFYRAEEYHQQYFEKQRGGGCSAY